MQISAYHRFVNTTPNPSATKNSNGELPLLPLPLLLPPGLPLPGGPCPGLPESVGDGLLDVDDGVEVGEGESEDVTCRTMSLMPSETSSGVMTAMATRA